MKRATFSLSSPPRSQSSTPSGTTTRSFSSTTAAPTLPTPKSPPASPSGHNAAHSTNRATSGKPPRSLTDSVPPAAKFSSPWTATARTTRAISLSCSPPVEAGTLDVACGWRHDRHDSWLRRRMSRLANLVRGRVLGDHLHDSGCQLRAMRREVVACLFPFELLQSFLPAIVVAAGFRLGEFRVRHHPRTRGEAKYGLRQLWLRPTLAMFRLRRRLRARS